MIFLIMPLNSVFAEWNANLTLPDSMSRIEYLMKQMQEAATEMIEKFVNVDTVGGLILNLFMIAGLAALGEELLFRSIIQTSLIKICKNAHIGILIASAIFSFIHFEFYGFVPRLILGMLLGYMFYFSGSIWIPMLMHFLNNGTVVLVYFLNNKGITNIDVDTFGQTSIPILIISIVVMIVLFIFSIKYSDKERTITSC
jgi:membrane protease YdiL (CAAX protease family)